MSAVDDDHRLEIQTLNLINMVAYASSSRAHSRRLMEATGIRSTPADVRVLEFLAGREPLPMSALAAALGTDLGQASRQAVTLEQLGHVMRTTDPVDRRRTLVCLSAETAVLMDTWLLTWTQSYLPPVDHWSRKELTTLAAWFAKVHQTLAAALPDRPATTIPERWDHLVPATAYAPHARRFLRTVISLVAWVGQSQGFTGILERVQPAITEHGYFTLRTVARHGPLSVAEVADRMAIDPSQASKRLRHLTELGLVDRAVDAFDRRSSRVSASRGGVTLMRKVRAFQLESFSELVDDISADDREQWTELLDRYLHNLGGAGWDWSQADTAVAVTRSAPRTPSAAST